MRCHLAFACAVAAATPAAADVVRLVGGGEVRGVIVGPEEGDALTVETLTGGVVAVARSDIAFVTRRPRVVEEYETRAKTAAETVAAQWALAEWCRENRLEEQRREHAARVVALDPDHALARAALGQSKYDGEWMTRDELMAKRGLVPHKGRYVSPEELDLLEKTAAEREREQAWFRDVRMWHSRLRNVDVRLRQEAVDSLRAVTDGDAVPALARFFRDDADPAVRALFVSVLKGIAGPKGVPPLVTQTLHDVDPNVRAAALDAIAPDKYDAALPLFLAGLRHERNEVVRRAGHALGRLGDERAVPDLVKSLITTHRYRIRVPDTSATRSFSTAGTFGYGGVPLPPDVEIALRTGQLPYGVDVVDPAASLHVRWRTVTVAVNHENPEVLAALKAITGESFGYDERTWRLWWAAKKNGAL